MYQDMYGNVTRLTLDSQAAARFFSVVGAHAHKADGCASLTPPLSFPTLSLFAAGCQVRACGGGGGRHYLHTRRLRPWHKFQTTTAPVGHDDGRYTGCHRLECHLVLDTPTGEAAARACLRAAVLLD